MLGLLLAGAWFLGNGSALPSLTTPSVTSGVPGTKASGAVSVVDQKAGETVIVELVTAPLPSLWITVREVSGDTLGNVLGAARVSGPQSNIEISLLRATEPGRSYAIELYRDDSDGAFDVTTNSVYVDFDTGASVIARFSTTD